MLKISLLGEFCICHDDQVITAVDSPRLQSLLSYLLLHRDTPQSRAHLAYLFWPDTTEEQARTNLRNLLHHLRRALPDPEIYLDVRVHSLQWRTHSPYTLDVDDFKLAVKQAAQAIQLEDQRLTRIALEKAIDHYKGELLPSCYDDWIISPREALQQIYLDQIEQLIVRLKDQY